MAQIPQGTLPVKIRFHSALLLDEHAARAASPQDHNRRLILKLRRAYLVANNLPALCDRDGGGARVLRFDAPAFSPLMELCHSDDATRKSQNLGHAVNEVVELPFGNEIISLRNSASPRAVANNETRPPSTIDTISSAR